MSSSNESEEKEKKPKEPKEVAMNASIQSMESVDDSDGPHWEVTADFNRLNVLLMRVEERDKKLVARKVATATMSDAKFQGRLGKKM